MSTSSIFGWFIILAVVAFFVYRKWTKKAVSKSSTSRKAANSYDDSHLISIAAFQKVVNDRFVVFDFETTGLSPENDQIVEIGAVRVEHGKITDTYQKLINPGIHMPEATSKKNHITDDMLKGCPSIKTVLPDFLSFVGSDVLAAHNASFDSAFLMAACEKYHKTVPEKYFDTMRLSVYWPNLSNRKLETFLKAAGIKNSSAHRALGDATATANLIIVSFNKIK